jgi:tRNA dimethylallyltransferase
MKPDIATASPDPPVIFLMGPTCSGKTAAAIELVQRLPLEIISVDSAMIYRGMDIGTAKPTPEVLARAPHRLIDIRDPAESYSAGEFRIDALAAIDAIRRRGRVPLLVGGTGLYFRALERGLSPLPPADAATREALKAEADRQGWPALHARLATVDPQAAARVHPHDPQRIQRALEVHALTGRSLTDWWGAHGSKFPYTVWKFVLCPDDREELRRRAAARFQQMLTDGFLNEVRRLRDRGDLHSDLPAMRVVGYRQAWTHLEGRCDQAAMIRAAVTATRQLAKRQLTWLRAEPRAQWLDACRSDQTDEMLRKTEHILHRHVKIKRL